MQKAFLHNHKQMLHVVCIYMVYPCIECYSFVYSGMEDGFLEFEQISKSNQSNQIKLDAWLLDPFMDESSSQASS